MLLTYELIKYIGLFDVLIKTFDVVDSYLIFLKQTRSAFKSNPKASSNSCALIHQRFGSKSKTEKTM